VLELMLARHGESFGNLDRSLGPDTDLTELGQIQAAQLGRWLIDQGCTFTAIYCSSLRRARQTAAAINTHYGLDIIFDPDLRETEQAYLDDMPRRADPLEPHPSPYFSPAHDGFRKRVLRATARILGENPHGHVLVVAHAGTVATMLRGILGVHDVLIGTDKSALHSLRWENGRWALQFVNRQAHLA
jgi:broad specificity phosphatase PhoE